MFASDEPLASQPREQLDGNPPNTLAPPIVSGYSLILLERGSDRERVDRVLAGLVEDPVFLLRDCPLVVRRQLSLTAAREGQFELICADSISVFIDDEVLVHGEAQYLWNLFKRLRESPEFQPVRVRVASAPAVERGRRFTMQFFGEAIELPKTQVVARKKGRLMRHWGERLGIAVEVDEL